MAVATTSHKKKGGGSGIEKGGGGGGWKRKAADGGGRSGGGPSGTPSERQSASNKKRALKHERQSHRRHSDVVVASKELWNKLRLKSNSPEKTAELMNDLMELIRGKVNEIAMQHDASRVVQAAVQFGSKDQRTEIVSELCGKGSGGNLSELAKVQYAHFVVLKVIKYCANEPEDVRLIVKALKGQIPKLAVHAVGARVVELLFLTFPPKSTATLKQELYGPQFSLFDDATISNPTLAAALESQPTKKEATLEHVSSLLNKGIDKSLFGFSYYQSLFREYVDCASPNDVRSIAPSIVDHSIHLLSTRAGTAVVCACVSYGTPKDRKRIMRSLKGYTRSSLLHRDAYLALLRIADVTDDTVTVQKSVLNEILVGTEKDREDGKKAEKDEEKGEAEEEGEAEKAPSPLLELALSETASKLFLLLLSPTPEIRRKYLDPYESDILFPNPAVRENGEDVPTSKKNPETRRKELVRSLRTPLAEICENHAAELLRNVWGSRVLREVWRSYPSETVAKAVLDACDDVDGAEGASEQDERKQLPMFEHPAGHLAVKNLLLSEVSDGVREHTSATTSSSCSFAEAFHEKYKGRLLEVASSNRGAFVVSALSKVESVRGDVVRELSDRRKDVERLAAGEGGGTGGATAGFEALLHEMDKK